jgi:hypothetical protein
MNNTFRLYGGRLNIPNIKFGDPSSDIASPQITSMFRKMKISGPYDKNSIHLSEISLAIIYPHRHERVVENFISAFKNGINYYDGFNSFFKLPIKIFDKIPVSNNTVAEYKTELNRSVRKDYNLIFVVLDRSFNSDEIYITSKIICLSNGIPCQAINSNRLYSDNSQLQWIIANISLAVYAKIGGTPWVIEAKEKPEIVLGMSRAMDKNRKVFVGFSTIFKSNGDYILFYSKSPVSSWGEYENQLEDLTYEAIKEYELKEKLPENIVFHFHKKTGRKEINAVQNAIKRIGKDIKYAILHLNSYSSFRLFDTSHSTYIPLTGLTVKLGSRQALLLSDGREDNRKRRGIGSPFPLEITMDKLSTMDNSEFPRLVKQVYDFSYVNWRAFNASNIPVTINYPYLIAKLISNMESVDIWNKLITNGKLVDKAWFI